MVLRSRMSHLRNHRQFPILLAIKMAMVIINQMMQTNQRIRKMMDLIVVVRVRNAISSVRSKDDWDVQRVVPNRWNAKELYQLMQTIQMVRIISFTPFFSSASGF